MTASGLGNFGLGNIGIYGQQDWQRRAQEERFQEMRSRGLGTQTTSPATASPFARSAASFYALGAMPQSAIVGGSGRDNKLVGALEAMGGARPSLGGAGAMPAPTGQQFGGGQQDWMRNMPKYQFPMMGMR